MAGSKHSQQQILESRAGSAQWQHLEHALKQRERAPVEHVSSLQVARHPRRRCRRFDKKWE